MLVSLGAANGCKLKQPAAPTTTTSVGQGERFEAGAPVYDEYFGTVHELHAAVATGELEERDARTSLATMLHLIPTAPADQILRKLRSRSDELPRVRLTVDTKEGTSSRQKATIERLDSARPDEGTKSLIMVLEATANADLDLAARMSEIPERSRRMHGLCKALIDGAEKEFSDQTPERRQRIQQELEASLDVLVLVANAARSVETRAREFVEELQAALRETEDNEPAQDAPKPWSGSAPAPNPEPKPPDDFNP